MIRPTIFALLCSFALVTVSNAADWSASAFPVKKHDFGTVAVSAKTEFEFPIHNPFKTTMHIRSVRTSCGCTTAILQDQSIEPGKTGTLLARFNTGTFRGKRGATLTVVVDRPQFSEVRLRVDGYIRSDMVFDPGAIEFGGIEQAQAVTNVSKVSYAGRHDWKIVDVRSNLPWLVPQVAEVGRSRGRVNYEISVTVGDDAPIGFFQDELVVQTNDRGMPTVPLRVNGEVKSPLTISPQAIAIGRVKSGESVRQKIVLICREPFQVESITAEGWDIDFQPSTEAKKTHILFAEFTALDEASGPRKTKVIIEAQGQKSMTAEALLTAEIRDR
ncbi:MAG: DUF1573 domain-containing protein [Rubripirellula sp.]|nr:DUF1573 domain-containing protein [Rubripirellula sp.]